MEAESSQKAVGMGPPPKGVFLRHIEGIVAEHERLHALLQDLSDQNRVLQSRLKQNGPIEVTEVGERRQEEEEEPVSAKLDKYGGPRLESINIDSSQLRQCDGDDTVAPAAPNGREAYDAPSPTSTSNSRLKGDSDKRKRLNAISLAHSVSMELSNVEPAKSTSEKSLRQHCNALLQTTHFDLFIGMLIVANTVTMSLQLQYDGLVIEEEQGLNHCRDGSCNVSQDYLDMLFRVSEQFFTAAFVLELVLRLGSVGPWYLCSWSNAADAVIVVLSGVDAWVLTPLGSENLPNINVLRLLRLLRLSKVLRVVRVMKAFKALRVLVSAVASSVGALGWSMTLLFVLELMAALFISQLLQPYIQENDRDTESKEYLYNHFGTWWRSMLSIFEITMAPGGFLQYRRLYEEVHPAFALFMVCYVCLVTFAVVRVITAMFLKATLSASEKEEALQVDKLNEKKRAFGERLQRVFNHEAKSEECYVSKDELEQLLGMEGMVEWLEDISLSEVEARRLFRAFDRGDGRVLFSEFITAILSMSGMPRASDIVVTMHETGRILEQVLKMERRLTQTQRLVRGATSGEVIHGTMAENHILREMEIGLNATIAMSS